MIQLPSDKDIDISILKNIFNSSITSYKFLFFQAMLQLIKKDLSEKSIFLFEELEKEMFEIANYPINVWELNFGKADQVAKILNNTKTNLEKNERSLIRYAPYRILTPFFKDELIGLDDVKKNNKIKELSNQYETYKSIYKISGKEISIYPDWMQYLKTNFKIIEDWAFKCWLEYLKKINTNKISLINNLEESHSLKHQRQYWSNILEEQEVVNIQQRNDVNKTQKDTLIKARVGQGIYKRKLKGIEKKCRVTGLPDVNYLIASHIKPWSVSNDKEKLDGNNGLLLSPHIDKLFDNGYISFENNGDVMISEEFNTKVLNFWNIDQISNVGVFNEQQKAYLEYHRSKVFKKTLQVKINFTVN